MITDLHLAMSSVSQKSQEPGVYVMESAAKANKAVRKQDEPGFYVVQAKTTARAIAGTAELNGEFNNETRAVCKQDEPGVYVVQAKTPTCALAVELNGEFNNEAEGSQREESAQHRQEKSHNKRAKNSAPS